MDHVQMPARELARRLRAQLASLKRERTKALAAYDRAFEAWKREMRTWLVKDGAANVALITRKDLDRGVAERVLKGRPNAPSRPDAGRIAEVQRTLRYIALTGVAKLTISQSDLDKWFGKEEDDGGEGDEG